MGTRQRPHREGFLDLKDTSIGARFEGYTQVNRKDRAKLLTDGTGPTAQPDRRDHRQVRGSRSARRGPSCTPCQHGPAPHFAAGHQGPGGTEVPPPCGDSLTEAVGWVPLRRLRMPDGSAETGWHVVV